MTDYLFQTPTGPAIVTSFHDDDCRIEVDGKVYPFEWSERFGPLPVNEDGSERKTAWPRKVWKAVDRWIALGKEKDGAGLCVWTPEPPIDMSNHIQIGRHIFPKSVLGDVDINNVT